MDLSSSNRVDYQSPLASDELRSSVAQELVKDYDDDNDDDNDDDDDGDDDEKRKKKMSSNDVADDTPKKTLSKKEKKKHAKLLKKQSKQHAKRTNGNLAGLVTLQAVHLPPFGGDEESDSDDSNDEEQDEDIVSADGMAAVVSSLAETRAARLLSKHGTELVAHTQRQLIRVYPKGVRVDSSNLAPLDAMLSGAQLVAMNWQTRDKPMWIYEGYVDGPVTVRLFVQLSLTVCCCRFFANNGNSGYVLKPPHWLVRGFHPHMVSPVPAGVLVVQVISGMSLLFVLCWPHCL